MHSVVSCSTPLLSGYPWKVPPAADADLRAAESPDTKATHQGQK